MSVKTHQFWQKQYSDRSQLLIKTFEICKITKYNKFDYDTYYLIRLLKSCLNQKI